MRYCSKISNKKSETYKQNKARVIHRENQLYLLHLLVKKKKNKHLQRSHRLPTDRRLQKTHHKKITSDKHLDAKIKKLSG